ncbi:hypothetical protein [Enterocloster clostridioformis]|nr:hypothetical protein [Enterocloster clostridioformis]MDB2130219.1 hypothetical protein [Enterocloster clostridioformis]
MFKDLKVGRKLQIGFGIVLGFNQKEGLIPRSLLRNKLFQDMEEEIY